jgi:hypothetical protein
LVGYYDLEVSDRREVNCNRFMRFIGKATFHAMSIAALHEMNVRFEGSIQRAENSPSRSFVSLDTEEDEGRGSSCMVM